MCEGGLVAMAPEMHAISKDTNSQDAWGRPIVTMAQAYAQSDAWAAGKMVWQQFADRATAAGGSTVHLPDPVENYDDDAIPDLPAEAQCP